MPFTAPKSSAFKQFVILDADGTLAALSALDGGQIDEILTREADESLGEASGEVNARVAKGGRKKNQSRRVEEEVRRARTRHATAAKLLETLHNNEAIGVVEGALDRDAAAQIEPGMVLEFRAALRLHPLHQADQMLRSFIEIAPKLGEKKTASELRSILDVWGAMLGTDKKDSRLLIEPVTSDPQEPRLLMAVPRDQLEVPMEDLLGEVTVVAQVERVLTEEEQQPAIRMLRGAPPGKLELSSLEEGLPDLIDGLAEMQIPISRSDVLIGGPAFFLRAIAVYR